MLRLRSHMLKNLALLIGFQYDLMIIHKWLNYCFWATLYVIDVPAADSKQVYIYHQHISRKRDKLPTCFGKSKARP